MLMRISPPLLLQRLVETGSEHCIIVQLLFQLSYSICSPFIGVQGGIRQLEFTSCTNFWKDAYSLFEIWPLATLDGEPSVEHPAIAHSPAGFVRPFAARAPECLGAKMFNLPVLRPMQHWRITEGWRAQAVCDANGMQRQD